MAIGNNVPELTVSELALSLKKTLEDTYSRVRIRGELSRVKIHTSGHLYSDLKDTESVLNIICWKTTLARLSIHPEEGLDVICTGKITSYPARSNYQMVVEQMELAGEGALLKMLEDRKKRLAAEGLFDESRKKTLPYLPKVIGVITSPTGAVIRDILHRLEDRFPRHVLLWPVRVQGDGAADEIVNAINGFNNLHEQDNIPKPDLLIIARGGGSLEDLMPFNEERVVRSIANCQIPIISAIGHETDTTLIDFVSDLRAPTPTAAAELSVPERLGILAFVDDCRLRLLQSTHRLVQKNRDHLHYLVARMGTPHALIESQSQKCDFLSTRLAAALQKRVQVSTESLLRLSSKIQNPTQKIILTHHQLQSTVDQLSRLMGQMIKDKKIRFESGVKLLDVLSFKSVLGRGFALIRDKDGNPVTSAKKIRQKDCISIELKDGLLYSIVEETR